MFNRFTKGFGTADLIAANAFWMNRVTPVAAETRTTNRHAVRASRGWWGEKPSAWREAGLLTP